MRIIALCLAVFWCVAPARAQESQEVGQMRLYIQQLEERLRQLTGQNEQLLYELNQLRAQAGQPPLPAVPGVAAAQPMPGALPGAPGSSASVAVAADPALAVPPQDPGALSVSPNDPLIAPDGAGPEGPVDLSQLAGGALGAPANGVTAPPAQPGDTQMAGLPVGPPATPGSAQPRDEYDLAYGYILTGDYALAEESFANWLAAFPDDQQAADARFWLGESHFQQGEYREAANAFLAVYKSGEASSKGPDALLKLGMSLSALGEKNAACATLAEVGRKYPEANAALMKRVDDEEAQAGC